MAKSKYWKKLEASANAIQKHLGRETLPDTLIVLGSGFKGFETKLENARSIELDDVPHFPVPTVEGHGSMLYVGQAGTKEVAVLTGRVHLYEGHQAEDVVYPLRVLSTLGVQNVLLTNAAGSVDPAIRPGQIVAVKDHLNLTGKNCLFGEEAMALGQVFIDMSEAYDKAWRQKILKLGEIVEGVYAGVLGPNYETPAETAMLHRLGANVVGMSTVLEVIGARHLSLRVACLSFVTNMAGGLGEALSHGEVLDLAAKNRPRLQDVLIKAVEIDL